LDEASPFKQIYVTERSGGFSMNSKEWKDNRQQHVFDFGNSEAIGVSKENLSRALIYWKDGLRGQESTQKWFGLAFDLGARLK
jgi:hypothetical protein